MRVHRIVLEGFRGVVHREVVLPDAGVVVLQGPNEVGKTSTLEALDMLLTEKHSSRKASVLATKPVDRDVSAEVEAEVSSGPYRFTYRKRWHAKPSTVLTVHAPRPEQLTGDAAHQRVRAILDETLDTGLWEALRLLQTSPLDASLTGSSALSAALDAAAGEAGGAVEAGEVGDDAAQDRAATLLEAAAAVDARHRTATGRPTGRTRTCAEEVRAVRGEVADAERALAEVADDADAHARLLGAREGAAAELAAAAAAVRTHREAVAALAGVRERAATARAAAEQARRAADTAASAAAARTRAAEDVAERSRRTAAAQERLAALRVEHTGAVDVHEGLRVAAREAGALAEQRRVQLDAAREAVRREHDVASLHRARRRVGAFERTLAEAEAAAADLGRARCDATLLRRVEGAAAEVDRAAARAETAATRVVVEAAAVAVVVTGGGVATPVAAGASADVTATSDLVVDVAGFATVRVLPPEGTRSLAEDAESAARALDTALAAAGAVDVDGARAAHEEHRAARDRSAAARRRLDELSEDGSLEATRAEVERLRAALGEDPGDTRDAPGAEVLRAAEAEARTAEQAARTGAAQAQTAAAAAERRVDELDREVSARASALDVAREEAALAARRLDAERGSAGDDELALTAAEGASAATAAAASAAAADRDLAAADPDGAARRLADAEARERDATSGRDRVERELTAVTARLDLMGREGRQESADAARTRLTALEAELDGLTRRAAAAALLHDTLREHRGRARSRYTAPFARALEDLGRDVFGDDFGIDLDDELRIRSRTLHGRTVAWSELSTGAREQLAVLTRLACAVLVSPVDGVPVVLDDALGHSDPQRLARLGAVLARVAPPAQVLLLAPGPGVQDSVPGATVVALT